MPIFFADLLPLPGFRFLAHKFVVVRQTLRYQVKEIGITDDFFQQGFFFFAGAGSRGYSPLRR